MVARDRLTATGTVPSPASRHCSARASARSRTRRSNSRMVPSSSSCSINCDGGMREPSPATLRTSASAPASMPVRMSIFGCRYTVTRSSARSSVLPTRTAASESSWTPAATALMAARASFTSLLAVKTFSAQARPMRTCAGYRRCRMERRRPQRPRNTSRVVSGRKATNSVSQIRNSREAPNRSVSVLATYHRILLPFSKPRLPPGISRHTAPRELKCSEVRVCSALA